MRNSVFSRLLKQDKGVAALETALILPVFILLLVGAVEIYQIFRAQSLVNKAAHEIAYSLSAQQAVGADGACMSTDSLCIYEAVAAQLLHPLDFPNHGVLSVALYTSRETPNGYIVWEDERDWSPVIYGNARLLTRVPARGPFSPDRADESLLSVQLAYELAHLKLTRRLYSAVTGSSVIVGRSVLRVNSNALLDKESDQDD